MIRILSVALALALAAGPAAAQDLVTSARASGQVGERYDGFLGVVGNASEPVRRQVGAINIKRRSLYNSLAARKGVSPQEVGLTAACTTMARVAVGELYFGQDQGWKRREAGQSAPIPPYCVN